MAAFDLAGARQHYQDSQIADYLGSSRNFDTAGARKAGYTDQQIIDHVMGMQHPPAAAPKAAAPAPGPLSQDRSFGDTLKGEGDLLATGVGNLATRAVNAGADVLSRVTGNGPREKPLVTNPQLGPSGQRLVHDVGSMLPSSGRDVSDAELQASDPTGKKPIEQLRAEYDAERAKPLAQTFHEQGTVGGDIAGHALDVAGDVADLAPAVGAVKGAVGLARGVTSATGDAAAQAARAAAKTEYEKAGFKTADSAKAGRVLAGDTAQPTFINHNADVFNTYAGSEARVPHGTPLSYESLEQARTPMNDVMERTGKALPTGELDGPAQIRAGKAGADITDTASQQQVANMRQLLAQPMSGEQRVQQLRQFRQEAYSRLGNEGANSTDQQAVGRAQLEMANAIEDHIGRNLPANGNVSVEQFQAARKALAKNYTVQSALRGNDIDPNVLARIQRADPQLLDGHMDLMARFANENREVVGLPTKLNAPGVAKDLANVNPLKLGSLATAATAGAGPALGRRLITGGPAAGRATARAATAGAGLGDEFAPLAAKPPQPPPGMAVAGEGAGGPHGPPPGNNSDLAAVMSHGVEQPPAPGLTVGPMGAPPAEGIPFRRNAAHEAGDLSLGDLAADLRRGGSNSDLAGVMSQGVPEGIMTRTASRPAGTRTTSQMPSAGRLGDVLTNNASGESAASQEAINRGTRDLVQVDPDGNAIPVLRDVTQADRRSPKGHLIVDRSSGEIIDRGGMNQRMAEGLRNRWASRVRLGDTFAPPRE